MATTYDLTQLAGNDPALSPVYTSDPTQAATALQTMQSELAYAQANPNDPNSAYIISQLTPSIQEQQNIINYDQATNNQTNISSAMSGLQAIQQGGTPTAAQATAIQSVTGKPASSYVVNGVPNAVALGSSMNSLQNQLNTLSPTLATDQSGVINNMTYAQPNYAGMSQQISNTFGGPNNGNPTGLYGSTVVPQLQDIYSVAYNNKMGTTAQLQNMGLGSSGAMKEAQQNQDDKALNKSLSSLSNFNNQEANVQNQLQQQQQQQQAQYQTTLNNLKGNSIGNALSGAANNLGQSFSNNMNANTQSALNNAQNQLLQQQQSDNSFGNLLNNLGSLAGTAVGTALNPTAPAAGSI